MPAEPELRKIVGLDIGTNKVAAVVAEVNTDGELELVKDAKDAAGDPLSFGRRVAQGYLPATDVKEKSFESVFPQEVLDKLLALQPE